MWHATIECGFYSQRISARSLRSLKVQAKAWADSLTYNPTPPVEVTVYRTSRVREIWEPKTWSHPNGSWHAVVVPTIRGKPREERLRRWSDLRR